MKILLYDFLSLEYSTMKWYTFLALTSRNEKSINFFSKL